MSLEIIFREQIYIFILINKRFHILHKKYFLYWVSQLDNLESYEFKKNIHSKLNINNNQILFTSLYFCHSFLGILCILWKEPLVAKHVEIIIFYYSEQVVKTKCYIII